MGSSNKEFYACLWFSLGAIPMSQGWIESIRALIPCDALPSPELNPLEGLTMLSCGKLGFEGRSRLPTLKRGRGAC
jgi:hypothetical protein